MGNQDQSSDFKHDANCTIEEQQETELFKLLLAGFQQITSFRIPTIADIDGFQSLLSDFNAVLVADRKSQERVADDFNLLEVLRVVGDENRHSTVLAWLLDWDRGTHAQGKLGFRLFLQQFGLPSSYTLTDYWVRREVAGEQSRVDLEIAARGQFLIHIENKIWTGEGPTQTDREWDDLIRRAKLLSINADSSNIHAFFLTPDGIAPSNTNFRVISWRQIAVIFELFAQAAIPPDVRLFAAHYGQGIRRFIVQEQVESE